MVDQECGKLRLVVNEDIFSVNPVVNVFHKDFFVMVAMIVMIAVTNQKVLVVSLFCLLTNSFLFLLFVFLIPF